MAPVVSCEHGTCRASARITRDLLGWEPARPGLIADLKESHYFT